MLNMKTQKPMKILSIILIILFTFSSVIAQQSLMDATVYLTDNQVLKGDVYLYDNERDKVLIEGDNGDILNIFNNKISYIENQGNLIRSYSFDSKYVLFDVIVEGDKLSLLRSTIDEKIVYYVYKDGVVYLLEGGRKTIVKDSKTYHTDNLRYKGVLKVLLKSDPQIVNKINNIDYEESDLANIVITYNTGRIHFVKSKDAVISNRKPHFLIYLKYLHVNNIDRYTTKNLTPSFIQGGVQYYFYKESRHSLKLGLESGNYSQSDNEGGNKYNMIDFNISYYMDFYRMPHSAFYFNVRIVDLVFVKENDNNRSSYFLPRISPGFGYKYDFNNINLFVELNNFIQIKKVPRNFSFGIAFHL